MEKYSPLQKPLKKKTLSKEETRQMMGDLRGKLYESMHPKPTLVGKLKSKMSEDLGDRIMEISIAGGGGRIHTH